MLTRSCSLDLIAPHLYTLIVKLGFPGVYILTNVDLRISVFETTGLFNLPIYSIFLWLLLPDLIGSLMGIV